MRQQGRERARNVLDAEPLAASIVQQLRKAESPSFRESLAGMTNPYGDGHAAERIVQVLTNLPPRERLLLKLDPGIDQGALPS
jgi:UDP-N-acetylglucosamine 2-epimerase (non-hydrolysing)/GDP/UDP-N,N'-diacetylbacillosamine 2-epimerase (hydrolysing)